GVLFAGVFEQHGDTEGIDDPATVRSFDQHAMYYTIHPDRWHSLPMFAARSDVGEPSVTGTPLATADALRAAKDALAQHHIRMFYRDLTMIDVEQLGLHVVRATSPDLASIFAHQEWPLIGGLE